MNKFIQFSIATFATALLVSCAGPSSNTTGWAINDKKNGGFQANLGYQGQEVGPGLVFVEGGTFMMGQVEEDFSKDWNNIPRRVTVSSFYMDENEVTNLDYREYLYWLRRVYDYDYYPEIYRSALPDTLVWRDKLAYNDNFVESIESIAISIENEDSVSLMENFNIMASNCGTCHKKFRN